jgi:hypothetical protein
MAQGTTYGTINNVRRPHALVQANMPESSDSDDSPMVENNQAPLPILVALSQQVDALFALENVIDRLYGTLTPLLGPMAPTSDMAKGDDQSSHSETVEQADTNTRRIHDLRRTLQILNDRLHN